MTVIRLTADRALFRGRPEVPTPARLKRDLTKMLALFGLADPEVSLSLVSDASIREINREWRKKDKPTDVLSFPQNDLPIADLLLAGKTAALLLGDIVISIETAERQAKKHKRPLADEITMLLAHGLLHLLGFDHRNDDEEREMDAYARVLEAAAKNRKLPRLTLSA